jgi:hypothetical protein
VDVVQERPTADVVTMNAPSDVRPADQNGIIEHETPVLSAGASTAIHGLPLPDSSIRTEFRELEHGGYERVDNPTLDTSDSARLGAAHSGFRAVNSAV